MEQQDDIPGILLEPREIFDKAILGFTNDDWPVYGYEELIKACRKAYKIPMKEIPEFVDYNIGSFEGIGLRIAYPSLSFYKLGVMRKKRVK